MLRASRVERQRSADAERRLHAWDPTHQELPASTVTFGHPPPVHARRLSRLPRLAIPALALLAMAGGGADGAGIADAAVQRADQLKAGYLLNFVKFVDWPASVPGNLLTVCFVGGKGVRDALASGIDNKMAGERHLAVRTLSDSETPAGCNVLYLDAAMMPAGAREPNTAEFPILTVSDAKAFAHIGGMIELFSDENHLRFNINVASAQKAGLHISSSLLQLAAVVEQAAPQ